LLQTQDDLRETHERLEDAENRIQVFEGLIGAVASLDGKVDLLTDLCKRIDNKTGFNATTFIATVVVPLLVVLITGYFAIRAQAPQVLPK
jgi:tetrahydromethanopterin S-methyltransferase subunit G